MKIIVSCFGALAVVTLITIGNIFFTEVDFTYIFIPLLVSTRGWPILFIVSIIYAICCVWKLKGKALIPFISGVAAVVVVGVLVMQLVQGGLRDNYVKDHPGLEAAVEVVQNEAPDPFDGTLKLPEEYKDLAYEGTVEVQRQGDALNVCFFFEPRVPLSNMLGIAYITEPSLSEERGYELGQQVEENWYFFEALGAWKKHNVPG